MTFFKLFSAKLLLKKLSYWVSSLIGGLVMKMRSILKIAVLSLLALMSSIALAFPVKAQCMITGLLGGGYCYDWGNMFSGSTVRIYPSGGKSVQAAMGNDVREGGSW